MINLSKQVYPVMFFLVFGFLGCVEKKEKDLEVQLYLMVEGTCLENHVLPEHRVNFKGGIIKWVYPGELPQGEKGTRWRGYLTRPTPEASQSPESQDNDYFSKHYNYNPPRDIELEVDHFDDSLPPEVTSGNLFTLQGVGMRELKNSYDKEWQVPQYKCTCQLQVIKQFDHYPTSEEKNLL